MFRKAALFPLRMLGYLPTLAMFALLAYLAYEGHERGWKWSETKESKSEKPVGLPKEDDDLPADTENNGVSPFDSTLTMTHDPNDCPLELRDLKFADGDLGRRYGIYLGTVREREMEAVLRVTGTVEFDPTRIARVSPRAGGAIWQIDKQVGDPVKPGEVLALIDASEVGKAKATFYQAKVQLDLKQQLRERLQPGISLEKTILEADAGLREARVQLITAYQGLLNLGLPFKLADVEKDTDAELARHLQFLGLDRDARETMPNETTTNLLPVRNPLKAGGFVLQRDGVTGETVAPLQMIFVVGDTSRMMLILDVRQEDRHKVAVGQSVRFTPDGENRDVAGHIDWLGQEIDPKTRTVKVRVFVANEDGRFRSKSFGSAIISTRPKALVLAVPEGAIQWEGCSHIVFAKEKADRFEVRKVQPGIRRDGFVEIDPGIEVKLFLDPLLLLSEDGVVEIKSGVREGDQIVVLGSHVLKSKLFKKRIGVIED